MDFSKEWEDAASCRCSDRLKPLERRKARQHQRCLAHSLVGTPNYIAPEVLLRTGTASHVWLLDPAEPAGQVAPGSGVKILLRDCKLVQLEI